MPKLILALLLSVFFLISPPQALALGPAVSCSAQYQNYVSAADFLTYNPTGQNIQVRVGFNPDVASRSIDYSILISSLGGDLGILAEDSKSLNRVRVTDDRTTQGFTVAPINKPGKYFVKLRNDDSTVCMLGEMEIYDGEIDQAQCSISMPANIKEGDQSVKISVRTKPVNNVKYTGYIFNNADIKNRAIFQQIPFTGLAPSPLDDANKPQEKLYFKKELSSPDSNTPIEISLSDPGFKKSLIASQYVFLIEALKLAKLSGQPVRKFCTASFTVGQTATTEPTTNQNTSSRYGNQAALPAGTTPITQQPGSGAFTGIKASGAGAICENILGGTKYLGVQTAIGCVPVEPIGLIRAILALTLSIGGGVAFLIMIMGAFRMITSAGNPDSLKAGNEMLTNAIIGLLFISFSVLLLQIVGVGILNIPGFS